MRDPEVRSVFAWASFTYDPRGRGGAVGRFRGFDLLKRRWGFDRSCVYVDGEKYLDRWIVYVNGYTLRLHKFYRGDDDRASHTHPWWFITFPLAPYLEHLFWHGVSRGRRWVEPWRFHFRPADFEHYVVRGWQVPWWTIVLTGPKRDTWGFYPLEDRVPTGRFVNYKDWE